jgi:hypothetical protein
MFRVLAALLFSTFTFVSASADQWYLSPVEAGNLGIAVAEPPLTVSTADFVSAEVVVVSAAPTLLPEDEALLMTAAEVSTLDETTTGSIVPQTTPALTAEYTFVVLEPWAVSRAEYEAQLTP